MFGKKIVKSSATNTHIHEGKHRFEHWYVDNQVYFITGRCAERYLAFASPEAQGVFWDRLEHYTRENEFFPWVASLIGNHYHVVGYCRKGGRFGEMMRKIHGSVAKLVNDTLSQRRIPFWREAGNQDYFDGCIRDEKQCRKAYEYTLTQCVRHGICDNWRDFPGTRVYIDVDAGVKRSLELHAFMPDIPYQRYRKNRRRGGDRGS